MCAKISFFRLPEHRVYNYTPRYYDPKTEALDEEVQARARARERAEGAKSGHYVPGALIQKAYRHGDMNKRQSEKRSPLRRLIGFCTLIAAMLAAYYIAEGLVKLLQ